MRLRVVIEWADDGAPVIMPDGKPLQLTAEELTVQVQSALKLPPAEWYRRANAPQTAERVRVAVGEAVKATIQSLKRQTLRVV